MTKKNLIIISLVVLGVLLIAPMVVPQIQDMVAGYLWSGGFLWSGGYMWGG